MRSQTTVNVLAIALAMVAVLAFALIYKGASVRGVRFNMEVKHGMPEMIRVVNDYKNIFHDTGAWPATGPSDDSAIFTYESTRTVEGLRIDTYDTLMLDRWIELHLSADGEIVMHVIDSEDQ